MQISLEKINLNDALRMVSESGENIYRKNIDRLVYRNLTGDHSVGGAESDNFKVSKDTVLSNVNQYPENLYRSGAWLVVNCDLPDYVFMMDIDYIQEDEEEIDYMEDFKKFYS